MNIMTTTPVPNPEFGAIAYLAEMMVRNMKAISRPPVETR
jgi:hypothetical protein